MRDAMFDHGGESASAAGRTTVVERPRPFLESFIRNASVTPAQPAKLGEEVAISMLKKFPSLFSEPFSGASVTKFDGTTITV